MCSPVESFPHPLKGEHKVRPYGIVEQIWPIVIFAIDAVAMTKKFQTVDLDGAPEPGVEFNPFADYKPPNA